MVEDRWGWFVEDLKAKKKGCRPKKEAMKYQRQQTKDGTDQIRVVQSLNKMAARQTEKGRGCGDEGRAGG